MTSQSLHRTGEHPAVPATDGFDPIGRIGREIIHQVDTDRISALLERRASSALLEELGGIVEALETGDPRGGGRRSGIVSRLLGRDLAGQARARQAHDHVFIRLERAERRAQDVAAHMRDLDEAVVHVERQRARLGEIADRGRGAFDAFHLSAPARPDAMARRLDHIAVLLSAWDVSMAHMRLVRQYGELLLARYAYVRDVIVPQWQRRVEGEDMPIDAANDPLREALASLLQATAPEPAVFPRGEDARV